jgi:ArsR family metal-binding transcriptional regulator
MPGKTKLTNSADPSDLLISDYRLVLDSPPCKPGAATWSARASLDEDIHAVLPYLNRKLAGADYDHSARILVWKEGGQSFAFRSREIKAAPARDREEAHSLIERAVAMANETWRGREQIEPLYEKRARINLMQVYRLLPRTNCGECGCSTCMAFAAGLLHGSTGLDRCPVLEQPSNREHQRSLRELLGSAAE